MYLEDEELEALEKEIDNLREEVKILKQCLAFYQQDREEMLSKIADLETHFDVVCPDD